jgi:hypothetical protein
MEKLLKKDEFDLANKIFNIEEAGNYIEEQPTFYNEFQFSLQACGFRLYRLNWI